MQSKFISFIIISLCMCILLPGCGWKTIGKVDMSKIISLEELWKNSENYIGKVVTVELDTVEYDFKGARNLPQGEQYVIAGITLNNRYLRTQEQYTKLWDAYIDSVGGKDSARGDTIFTGNYEVGFIFDDIKPLVWPGWVKNPPQYLALQVDSWDWVKLEKKPKKYLCGVLLGCTHLPRNIDWIPEYDSLGLWLDFREIIIMPIGYKYKKAPEIPIIEVDWQ